MRIDRLRSSLVALTFALSALPAAAQSAQALFEKGAYDQAVQKANAEGGGDPAATFLAGQALLKLDRDQDARTEFTKLANGDNETWKAIGQSAIALLDNSLDDAANQGRHAREVGGDSGYAFYQAGLVHIRRNEFDEAAQALDRAAELMPDFAYAHYYTGVAHQRAKRYPKMAEHFQAFLRLAPDAPEKRQVQLALSSLKG